MRVPFIRSRLLTVTAVAALGAALAAAPFVSQAPALASSGSSVVNAPVFTLPLNIVGQVNFSSLAKSEHRTRVAAQRQGAPISKAAAQGGSFRVVDNAIAARRPNGHAEKQSQPGHRRADHPERARRERVQRHGRRPAGEHRRWFRP